MAFGLEALQDLCTQEDFLHSGFSESARFSYKLKMPRIVFSKESKACVEKLTEEALWCLLTIA